MPTIGSLFDGSGGFPLAASICEITPVWASEVEPYPIAVTRSRFPKMKHLGDISRVNGAEIEPVDIITFGSPCQDMSVAGKREGIKHSEHGDEETTRSGLFYEAIRIIKEMRENDKASGRTGVDVRPRFIIWENVAGAFSSNGGEDFRLVLEEIIKIAEPQAVMPPVPKGGWAYADSYRGDGWSLSYRVFDAQYWGVPQRRRRIYLIADFGGQCAEEILFEREGLRWDFAESRETRKTIADNAQRSPLADDRAGAVCYGISSHDSNAMKSSNPNDFEVTKSGVNSTIVAKGPSGVCYSVDTTHADDVVRINPYTTPTLRARDFKGGNAVCYWDGGDTTGTLTARNAGGSQRMPDKDNFVAVIEKPQYIVRRLTPTECARLQGFPDKWGHPDHKDDMTAEEYAFWREVRMTYDRINGRNKKAYTDAQILKWYNSLHNDGAEYKMWGNGIALPCALYIMKGIAEVLKNGRRTD